MTNKIEQLKMNNRGMTMSEVLVGFVVLMIFMGGLSGIISFSSKMLMESVDIYKAELKLEEEVYKNASSSIRKEMSGTLVLKRDGKDINLSHMKLYYIDSNDITDCDLNVAIYAFDSDN